MHVILNMFNSFLSMLDFGLNVFLSSKYYSKVDLLVLNMFNSLLPMLDFRLNFFYLQNITTKLIN